MHSFQRNREKNRFLPVRVNYIEKIHFPVFVLVVRQNRFCTPQFIRAWQVTHFIRLVTRLHVLPMTMNESETVEIIAVKGVQASLNKCSRYR